MNPARGAIVAAAASHSGKTTFSLGLIAALRARGLAVAAAKCGPDYIDPKFLETASGHPAINLDPWAMGADGVRERLARHVAGVDIVVVEGVMGLFDGGPGGAGSTADLARMLGLPVLVVVGAQGMAQTAAALAEGCRALAQGFAVAGAVVNQVASDRHAALVAEGFERSGVPLFGMVRRAAKVALPSRHLGLVQAAEQGDLAVRIARAGELVEVGCDVDGILAAMGTVASASFSPWEKVSAEQTDEGEQRGRIEHNLGRRTPSPVACGDTLFPRGRVGVKLAPLGQRIAVAADLAFGFAYPHLLGDWREQGAEISLFSPLADEGPRASADAVFVPGGYPELHAGRLAAAAVFRAGMEAAARRGALIYGECGGYMVLGEALTDADGAAHRMLGLLPASTSFAARKLHLGYRRLTPLGGLPWDVTLAAHEFHFATIEAEGDGERLFAAADAGGAAVGAIGLRRGRVMGSFAHVIDAAG